MTAGTEETRTVALEARVADMHRRATMVVQWMIVSIVLVVAIALYVISTKSPPGLAEQTRIGFYAAAAFLALGSIFYRRTQMRRIRLEVVAGLRGIDGLLKHFFQVTLISAALAGGMGLLALAVSFSGGDRDDVVRFGVVALAVALFSYPRLRSWQQATRYFAETVPGIE